MASIYVGLNRGAQDQGPDKVTEGASTGATDVELRFDTGKALTRKDINLLTRALLRYINDGRVAVYTVT